MDREEKTKDKQPKHGKIVGKLLLTLGGIYLVGRQWRRSKRKGKKC